MLLVNDVLKIILKYLDYPELKILRDVGIAPKDCQNRILQMKDEMFHVTIRDLFGAKNCAYLAVPHYFLKLRNYPVDGIYLVYITPGLWNSYLEKDGNNKKLRMEDFIRNYINNNMIQLSVLIGAFFENSYYPPDRILTIQDCYQDFFHYDFKLLRGGQLLDVGREGFIYAKNRIQRFYDLLKEIYNNYYKLPM